MLEAGQVEVPDVTAKQKAILEQAKAMFDQAEREDSFAVWQEGIRLLKQVLSRTLVKDLIMRRAEIADKFGEFSKRAI